jgi:hypothetical protein
VAAAKKAAHHIGAHPPESDHSELHSCFLSKRSFDAVSQPAIPAECGALRKFKGL